MQLNQYIDHTFLKPFATSTEIKKLCDEALKFNFKSVCIPPSMVEFCKNELSNSNVLVCTVIGFPLGYNTSEVKIVEMRQAIEQGATEIDMVVNIGDVKMHQWDKVHHEIASSKSIAVEHQVVLKVIFETCFLNNDEIAQLCEICTEIGVDFVKTSTGFGTAGASVEVIRLMKANIGKDIQIKASGGVKNLDICLQMIEAGATRIGTSNGVEIMEAYLQNK